MKKIKIKDTIKLISEDFIFENKRKICRRKYRGVFSKGRLISPDVYEVLSHIEFYDEKRVSKIAMNIREEINNEKYMINDICTITDNGTTLVLDYDLMGNEQCSLSGNLTLLKQIL